MPNQPNSLVCFRKESLKRFLDKYNSCFSSYLNEEIKCWEKIKEIISFFMSNDDGSPIVDFIDRSNWDSVQSYSFCVETRKLEMVWHDFHSPEDDLEISIFGANHIRCDVIVDSIVITLNKGFPVVLIKGYYQSKKTINRIYNTKCSDYEMHSFNPFSWEVLKVVKKELHSIIIPNLNCFTTSLVPNCARFIAADDSKELMYDYNIKFVSNKILKLLEQIGDIDENNQEELQAKGNSVRKNFENALKILNLKAGVEFDEEYQKLMLGDLTKIISNFEVVKLLDIDSARVVDILNTCSHDSGSFVKKDELLNSVLFVLGVIHSNN